MPDRFAEATRLLSDFEVCTEVAWGNSAAVAKVTRAYEELYLSPGLLSAEVANINLLPRLNRDQLHVNLPRLTARGLYSLSLGSVSQVADSLAVYREVARDFLARTEEEYGFIRKVGTSKRSNRGSVTDQGPLCCWNRVFRFVEEAGLRWQGSDCAAPSEPPFRHRCSA
jgi:hypothetical protein